MRTHPTYRCCARADALWRELEHDSGERVLHITGSLEIGVPGSEIFDGTLASCRIHDLPHEILTSQQISQRFPAYRLPQGYAGVLQPDGGFLDPEGCITAHLTLATGVRRDDPYRRTDRGLGAGW